MISDYIPGQEALIVRLREYCDSDMTAAADGLEAKDAEIKRLNRCLTLEQNRLERIGTHDPGCWAWGPAHWECA